MPNTAGVNNIDKATVLPSITPVMMHFSDQFAQREAQRIAQQQENDRIEEARQIALRKYEGDTLNPEHIDPSLHPDLQQSLKRISEAHLLNKSIPEIMSIADQEAQGLAFKSKEIKAKQIGAAKMVADFIKTNPYADPTALTTGVLANIEKTGKPFDPTHDYITNVVKDLGGNLYHPQAVGKAESDFFGKLKMMDVEEPATYNDNGSLKTPGFKGKLPDLVQVDTDKSGNVIYKNGKASYSVHGENYRMPGDDHDYIDPTGKPVKVVPQGVFDKVYRNNPAMVAPIERQVRQILETPVKTANGDVQMGPDSDYADMLRKKLTYDFLTEQTAGKFPLSAQEDKSFQNKNAIDRLNLAKANHSLSQQRFEFQKEKAAGKDLTVDDIVPLTFTLAQDRGVDIVNGDHPETNQRIVYTRDIGDKEAEIIVGSHKNEEGVLVPNVKPKRTNTGKPYYEVKPNGDWEGEDDKGNPKIIPTDQVKNEQLKYLSKDDLPASSYVKPVPKKDNPFKSGIKKAVTAIKNAITPTPKIKGTNKNMFE